MSVDISLSVSVVRQFLLFSSQLAVRGIPFNLSAQEDVILPITGTPSYFVGVDFSAEDDAIFFSDTAKDMIYKQNVDGTGETFSPLSSKPPPQQLLQLPKQWIPAQHFKNKVSKCTSLAPLGPKNSNGCD